MGHGMGHGKRRSSRRRSLSEQPAVVLFTNKLDSRFSPAPRGSMANLRNWRIRTMGPDSYCNGICIQINTWQPSIRSILAFSHSTDKAIKRLGYVAWKKLLPLIPMGATMDL
ncbi:uncharacterized protein EAF02_006812 [Botrytis sinoallii]|uniref:uncharacterized protein n=1 Tax=Botrytis sinoallii TaxID=1463999 RepID=UPI0019004282|nr:uncharacterized protein EAF02_006812 [Botrytis sinoallii]KAF7880921.1 hypothetical protein EAF02_006812 [Botrytis sinoallii]